MKISTEWKNTDPRKEENLFVPGNHSIYLIGWRPLRDASAVVFYVGSSGQVAMYTMEKRSILLSAKDEWPEWWWSKPPVLLGKTQP